MNITINKKKVIEALKTEPLTQGSFFRGYLDGASRKECEVCAVGAVLRKHLGKGKRLEEVDPDLAAGGVYVGRSKIKSNLVNGNYLGALSCYFEGMDTGPYGTVDKSHRKDLVDFVKTHFPNSFKVRG